VGDFEAERAYLEGTMAVATTFRTDEGAVRLVDALALEPGARGHDIGLRSPHALLRTVEGLEGEVRLDLEWAPRPEYALVVPELMQGEGGRGVQTAGGPVTLALAGDGDLRIEDGACVRAEVAVRAGERASWLTQLASGVTATSEPDLDPAATLDDTVAAWRSWSAEHDAYDGPYRTEVARSALVIQALTYAPTGAVVAAPTTSLPELPGGDLNWDYRYAWLRDASLMARAMSAAACADEAERYFEFMCRAAMSYRDPRHVQVVYGVDGERELDERELEHFSGWRGSRPVRVGNAAWGQKQLDVLGEVTAVAELMHERGIEIEPASAMFARKLVDLAAEHWGEPDSGIWEGRAGEHDYTLSKVMCWVALDRGVRLAPVLDEGADRDRWAEVRDEIRDAVRQRAWSERRGAYAGALDSDRLDVAVLLLPIVGFLPMDDERMRATVDVVRRELSADGVLLRRWEGAEDGAFLPASFWLAECLARGGEPDEARAVFDSACAHANDLGLLSEEVDPRSGELLGNFPQALSHVALVTAAEATGAATACGRRRSAGVSER